MEKKHQKKLSASDERRLAADLWAAKEYAMRRGHSEYVHQARLCEDFTLGGGLQWSPDEHATNDDKGKLSTELNGIFQAVNSACGYQINNRMEIKLRPRGRGADEERATTLQKVVMQIADNCTIHQKESEVFADGAIQQRGYFEVFLDFTESVFGEVKLRTLDPMDVIPDADAKAYDPDEWDKVQVLRWYTYDQVLQRWGIEAAKKLDGIPTDGRDEDFGEMDTDDVPRAKFGMETAYSEHLEEHTTAKRWPLIETQSWEWSANCLVAIFPEGDVRVIEGVDEARVEEYRQAGAVITRRNQRRVRWTVSSETAVLFHSISPFPWFSVVPYFWFFRRGRMRGMVDNAISPQQVQNKALSQFIHILATAAGSGWITEQGSLSNMTAVDLEQRGGEAGLHVEVKAGSQYPKRIDPPPAPQGLRELLQLMPGQIQAITGVNAAMQGMSEGEESGIALQSRQAAAQQQLAVPLDNLSRTRHMLAKRIVWLIQNYYDYPRIFRITEEDALGNKKTLELPVNQEQQDGTVLNDLTIGEYDIVLDTVPVSVTFENGEFQQLLEMYKLGVPIPPAVLIQASNMARKQQTIEAMAQQPGQSDPLAEAKAALTQAQAGVAIAQAAKVEAETVSKRVEALYSATTAGALIATQVGVAPVADQLLRSAGYKDSDAAPIVAQPAQAIGPVVMPPENTNPLTPPNPQVGALQGIESGLPV